MAGIATPTLDLSAGLQGDLRERVAAKLQVNKDGGADACWPASGMLVVGGYIEIYIPGAGRGRRKNCVRPFRVRAHRAAFVLHNGGRLSKDDFVCHRCDNPPCCNPAHLFKGTPGDNVRDMRVKGRGNKPWPTGAKCHFANYTEAQVLEAVRLANAGIKRKEIQRVMGMSKGALACILLGYTWGHVTGIQRKSA